jgi:hypothetical protein
VHLCAVAMVVLVNVLFRYQQRSTRVCKARSVKLDSVARLLRNGLCDNVSVILISIRKGWQFLAEKVGVSSQTVSLFECWCLGTYWLVARAAGQKIILADSWERQDCTNYITVTIVAACLPLRLWSHAQACTAILRWPRIMHEAGVHDDTSA